MCNHPAQCHNHLVTTRAVSMGSSPSDVSQCDVIYLRTGRAETRGACHGEAATPPHQAADLEGLRDVVETLVELALGSLHLLQLQPAHCKHALQEKNMAYHQLPPLARGDSTAKASEQHKWHQSEAEQPAAAPSSGSALSTITPSFKQGWQTVAVPVMKVSHHPRMAPQALPLSLPRSWLAHSAR